jgi:hypothetical protein
VDDGVVVGHSALSTDEGQKSEAEKEDHDIELVPVFSSYSSKRATV